MSIESQEDLDKEVDRIVTNVVFRIRENHMRDSAIEMKRDLKNLIELAWNVGRPAQAK